MPENISIDFNAKRPTKSFVTHFIETQYEANRNKLKYATDEAIKEQLAYSNIYIYEKEVMDMAKAKQEADKSFDAKAFIEKLKSWGCIKPGSSPKFGEGVTRIDSDERAKQIANDPKDVATISAKASQMKELAKEIEALSNIKISIAFKTKKTKKKAKTEEAVKSK